MDLYFHTFSSILIQDIGKELNNILKENILLIIHNQPR